MPALNCQARRRVSAPAPTRQWRRPKEAADCSRNSATVPAVLVRGQPRRGRRFLDATFGEQPFQVDMFLSYYTMKEHGKDMP